MTESSGTMQRAKDILSALSLPLFALAAFGLFYVVWAILGLPSKEEVIRLAQQYFDQYGLITVFVAAILESMLFAGWYFPGSLVIVLAVVFAGNDILQLLGVYVATTIGFLISYSINFYVGAYGWYRVILALGFQQALENAQAQLKKYGTRAIFLTYWHPNLGALTSTAAGILRIQFREFIVYSVIATALWNAMWTVIGHTAGPYAITLIGPKYVIAFISLWVVGILVYRYRWQPRKSAAVL